MNAMGLRLSDVKEGQKLPELVVDVTTTMIVAGALATQDFTPVHHDRGAAQAQGLSDIIMNTMTTNGVVSRFVTDWAGANAVVKKIAVKLGTPNFPGEKLKMSGTVKSVDGETGLLEVDVTGSNSWGDHVTATVALELAKGG
jgi:acyl dehydratase